MKALIVVDVQKDFCEEGSLAVAGGNEVARRINDLIRRNKTEHLYDFIVATRDHHLKPGAHFAAEGTDPDYVDTWPHHCVAGTTGAEFNDWLNERDFDAVFLKGMTAASYTGFDGVKRETMDATLGMWLDANGVDRVEVCGLALDYCVKATALDAAELGYGTVVLKDLTAAVAPATGVEAEKELLDAGVTIAGALI